MAGVPQPKQIVTGRLFIEPMRVETAEQIGDGTWRLGLVGTQTEKFRSVTLSAADLTSLIIQRLKRVILIKEGKREGNKGKCRTSGDHGGRPASQDKEERTV